MGVDPRLRQLASTGTAAGSRMASAVFGILQLSFGARLLAASEFGAAAVALAFAAIASVAFEPPILGYQRLAHHTRDPDVALDRPRAAARGTLLLMSGLGLAVAAGAGAFGDSPLYYVATGVWTLSLVQLRWATVQYLNWGELNRFTATVVGNSAARAGGFVLGAAVLGSASAALLVGGVGSLAVTAALSPRPVARGLPERQALKGVLAVGAVMTMVSAANVLVGQGVFIVGSRNLGAAPFAAFAAQMSLAQAAFLVTAGFFAVVGFPRVKRNWETGAQEQAGRDTVRYAWLTLAAGTCFSAAWFVAGDWITAVFLSPKYSGHVVPAVASIGVCLGTVALVLGWIPQLRFQQNVIAVCAWIAAGFFFAGAYLLGSHSGVGGILILFVCAAGVQVLLVTLVARQPATWMLAAACALLAGAGCLIAMVG